MKLLPPRKKDWTPGTWQLGVFLRSPDGSVVEWLAAKGTPEEADFLLELIRRDGKGAPKRRRKR